MNFAVSVCLQTHWAATCLKSSSTASRWNTWRSTSSCSATVTSSCRSCVYVWATAGRRFVIVRRPPDRYSAKTCTWCSRSQCSAVDATPWIDSINWCFNATNKGGENSIETHTTSMHSKWRIMYVEVTDMRNNYAHTDQTTQASIQVGRG